jgi:hypothetical protein
LQEWIGDLVTIFSAPAALIAKKPDRYISAIGIYYADGVIEY